VVPFYFGDVTVAAETDTGLDFTAGQIVLPWPTVRTTVADATETIDVGLLSSESGGDADGLLALASVGAVGSVIGSLLGTDTLGALLKEDTNGSTVNVPKGAVIAAATSIVLLLSTGSDTAEGFVLLAAGAAAEAEPAAGAALRARRRRGGARPKEQRASCPALL
jgi:hypothetical protein